MKRFLHVLLLTCMAVRGGWEIHWSPDYRNVGLKLVTECKGKVPFYSVDFVPIETDWDHITTRRQPTPVGERCTVIVDVEQNADGEWAIRTTITHPISSSSLQRTDYVDIGVRLGWERVPDLGNLGDRQSPPNSTSPYDGGRGGVDREVPALNP